MPMPKMPKMSPRAGGKASHPQASTQQRRARYIRNAVQQKAKPNTSNAVDQQKAKTS
jgi:hypothetical protein